MRLLVLDPSGILCWRIRHALGGRHELVATESLEEAERLVSAERPDGAAVSVPHGPLALRGFQERCSRASPPVPVLYETCLAGGLAELDLVPAGAPAEHLAKPSSQAELEAALARLLAAAAVCAAASAPEERLSRATARGS